MSGLDFLRGRYVSRLCHFTKLKDLTHILLSDRGIVASTAIRLDVKDQKDPERYDGELEYICCSIEYPNSWYLRKAQQRDNDPVFREWVTVYIDLGILEQRDFKFCPCNAATKCGTHILNDENQLSIMYESPSIYGRDRTPKMLRCCPTDDQAEILIKDSIPYCFFSGISVSDEEIASRVYAMIKTYGKPNIPIYIAPDVLNTNWSNMIRRGIRPSETLFFNKEEII